MFRVRLLRKYGGLKWFDQDSTPQHVFTAHPTKMKFKKVWGNNQYTVFVTLEGYSDSKLDDDQENSEFWEPWEFFDDFMILCAFIMRAAMRLSDTKRMNRGATVMKNRLMG